MDWQRDITGFLASAKRPLVVVLGPTASGKTAFSLALARFLASIGRVAETVNADSRQLYRYLDIGTAKVREEEMQGVPHHLLSVLDPREEASAGWYQREAHGVIREISDRGAVPVLVGGSMLYVSSIIDALTLAPAPDPLLREKLVCAYRRDGGAALLDRLRELDPEAAEDIHPRNMHRLVRTVEICEMLRRPRSSAVPKTELRSSRFSSPYDLLIFGMHWERKEICRRIDGRTSAMFEAGWVGEVENLLHRGYRAEDPGLKSHGYREIIAFMEGALDDLEALRELIAAKTRQYARRQMAWWKGDSRIRWIDAAAIL